MSNLVLNFQRHNEKNCIANYKKKTKKKKIEIFLCLLIAQKKIKKYFET